MGHREFAAETAASPAVDGPLSVAQQLLRSRSRGFVGRAAELSSIGHSLDGQSSIFLVHGVGGIGKSALLRRLADDAESHGRPVAQVGGDEGPPDAAEVQVVVHSSRAVERPLVLIDGIESNGPAGAWLREDVLPHAPQDATVVIAGRGPPAPQWLTDPGWSELVTCVALNGLSPSEASMLLDDGGVPAHLLPSVRRFGSGHPMALSLAARAVRETADPPEEPHEWQPPPQLVRTLLDNVVGQLPSPSHRRALEVCAHVRITTVDVLGAEVGKQMADELFAWLGGLPYMQVETSGIRPHALVRQLVDVGLRWRDPAGHVELHGRLWRHLTRQAATSTNGNATAAASALMFLHRHRGVDIGDSEGPGEPGAALTEVEYEPDMRNSVLGVASHVGGPESSALVDFWLTRQPEAFRCYWRAGSHHPDAFLAWLRSTHRDPDEVRADPIMAAVWDHVESGGLVRQSEQVAVARFILSGPDSAVGPSAVPFIVNRISTELLQGAGRLAAAYLVLPDASSWKEALAGVDVELVAEIHEPGGRCLAIFGHDFRTTPLADFLDRSIPIGGDDRPTAPATMRGRRTLTRDDFDAGVRSVLRNWHRADVLAANPLVRSRAAIEMEPREPLAGLRRLVADAVERLGGDPHTGGAHRAVVATYLERSVTQEAAATRLGIPFSTFRRHLARGVTRIIDHLWTAEQHGVTARPT